MGHRRQRQPQVPWRFRQRRPRSSSTVRSGAPKSTPPLLVWGGHPCPPPLPSILILRQPTDLATLSFRAIRSRGSDEDARRNLPSVHTYHSDRRRSVSDCKWRNLLWLVWGGHSCPPACASPKLTEERAPRLSLERPSTASAQPYHLVILSAAKDQCIFSSPTKPHRNRHRTPTLVIPSHPQSRQRRGYA